MKGLKAVKMLSLVLAVIITAGCGTGTAEQAALQYAPPEEDRLVVYTAHKEEVYWPIIKEFEERTGIWVEIVPGGTNELLTRLAQEKDAPQADVMFGGGVDSLEAYADCFTPYFCRDWVLLDYTMRSIDGLWTPFSALPVVLIYNTKLVSPGRLTCWKDLFSPAWQGRIAFCDPSVSGSSFTGLVTLLEAAGGDLDETLQAFAVSLDGRQLETSGQVLDAVADGTDLVGITLEETALKRAAEGAEIALVYPSDGTSCVPDGGALVKGAPHEKNAQRFLDFIASPDVQQRMETEFSRRPIRQTKTQAEGLVALADIPTLDYDISWASENHDKILMSWAFYFGGGEEP
jgi:iron(III) transport system substrate-binding protein